MGSGERSTTKEVMKIIPMRDREFNVNIGFVDKIIGNHYLKGT